MSRTERMTELDERLVAAAEADLQQLLSIDPSPEFAARVRSRIDENRQSRVSKRWGWIGLAVATAAAVILVVVLRTDHNAPTTQRVAIPGRPDITLKAPPVEHNPSPLPTAPHQVASRRGSTPAVAPPASPEVIIDAAMTDAIRRMAMSLRNTRPDAAAAEQLQIETGEPVPLTIAEPLNVPELVLRPADQNGGN
jgi:hypothetical protein